MNQYTVGALSGELPDIGQVDSPDMDPTYLSEYSKISLMSWNHGENWISSMMDH